MNIIKQPDFETFDGNLNYLIIEPTQIDTSLFQYGKVLVVFNDFNNDGQYVYLNGVKLTMSSVINDTDKFLTLTDKSVALDLAATVESFISAINTNPILNDKFYAQTTNQIGVDVEIVSLYAGVKNILNIVQDINVFGLFIPLEPVAEYESEIYKNYKYKIELWESKANYPNTDPSVDAETKICELVKTPILKKETYFDLNECVKVETLLPTIGGVSFQKAKRYYTKIKELATNTYNIDQERLLDVSQYFYQLQGSFNHLAYIGLNIGGYINTPVAGGVSVLTNLKKKKTHFRTDFDQREFVSFYNTTYLGLLDPYDMVVELIITYTDGSTGLFFRNTQTFIGDEANGKHILDISPSNLGLSDIEDTENNTIQKYTVAVIANLGVVGIYPITEPLKFEIIDTCNENKTQLLFLNPLGGWDTHFFTGSNDKSVTLEQTFIEISKDPYINEYVFETAARSAILNNEQKLNSRYLNKTELEWLKDLLKSPQIYVLDKNDKVKPVTIKSFDYNWDNLNEVYVLNVVIADSYNENSILR